MIIFERIVNVFVIFVKENRINMKLKYLRPMTDWALLGPEYALMNTLSGGEPEDFTDGGELDW